MDSLQVKISEIFSVPSDRFDLWVILVLYSLHSQMFVVFDFYINFDHLFFKKIKVIKNQI
jgi:hypothetical protein